MNQPTPLDAADKLDPTLRRFLLDRRAGFSRPFALNRLTSLETHHQHIAIKIIAGPPLLSTEKVIAEQRGRVILKTDEVLLAHIPADSLLAVAQSPRVRKLEAPIRLRHLLDRSVPSIGLSDVARAGRTGSGVIVGVIDSGIDWTHPDFMHADDRTRIDLLLKAEFVQTGMDQGVHHYSEFGREDINSALAGIGDLKVIDNNGHGTHVAGIAAGNGRASNGLFRGVAYDAALMVMHSEDLFDDHIIYGIKRIFAAAKDRPAVINISLGTHLGAHDGTSALETAIANESGPGRIVVVAAGNDGDHEIHARVVLTDDQHQDLEFLVPDTEFFCLDAWHAAEDEIDVVLVAPDGQIFRPSDAWVDTMFGRLQFRHRVDSQNYDWNTTVFITEARMNHKWRLRLSAKRVISGEVHAWAVTNSSRTSASLFTSHVDRDYTISIPATSHRAISVGAYVSSTSFATRLGETATGLRIGSLAAFSSRGPTRWKTSKPDVIAPGQYITAPLAKGSVFEKSDAYTPRIHANGRYITIQGTSMAAPHVTGIIALMLEQNPHLTPEAIQHRLRITSVMDTDTGPIWNNAWGFGKLDAAALLSQ